MSGLQRQSRFERGDDVVVMKFGGTSVEDAAAIRRVIGIVESRIGAQPVVVVSALAHVTDQLLEAGKAAANGHLGSALAAVRNIYVRHEQLADSLVGESAYSALDRELRGEFRALETLLLYLEASRDFGVKEQDHLLSFGECFSSRLVQEALRQAGLHAAHVDARACIVTDARHGQAVPVWDATEERLREMLSPLLQRGIVPVLGGFIASTRDGVPTTLGRGGSDLTAAIVGAALGAARVEIWTDVDGIMTTDPKLCADARLIQKMSFEEASELARCGAKVLHPAALAPAMHENIPVYVLNSRRPEGAGTEIVAQAKSGETVTAIAARRNITAVEIASHHATEALVQAVYAAFDRHDCPLDVTAAAPGRMSLLAGPTSALPAISTDLQGATEIHWENHKALVCLVGENLRRDPEVASRALAALSDMNARLINPGSSDRAIAFLVDDSAVQEAVRRLHAVFFTRPKPTQDWGGLSTAFCQAG